jgi:hypothetical protein
MLFISVIVSPGRLVGPTDALEQHTLVYQFPAQPAPRACYLSSPRDEVNALLYKLGEIRNGLRASQLSSHSTLSLCRVPKPEPRDRQLRPTTRLRTTHNALT